MDWENRRKRERGYAIAMAVILLLILLVIDWMLIERERNHYQEKLDILIQMTESKGDLDIATGLLKGKKPAGMGEATLESYGYELEGTDYYWRICKRNIYWICGVSLMLYLLFLLSWLWENRRGHLEEKEILGNLEGIVSDLRQGKLFEPDSGVPGEMSGILMELEALGNTAAIWREESLREKEGVKSLVTDISHQLKTPVAALKASVEILQQEGLTKEEREEFLRRCSQQLEGLENLLSALIQISRMEGGMIEVKKEEASVFRTLLDAVNRVYPRAEEKGIEIELEAEGEVQDIIVPHDPKWLCEAFINILENAVKYSPRESHITIRMGRGISFLRIEFEDEGIGIAREDYHRIFKRFYRGQAQEVRREKGSGVGLYLTREIMGMHGGTIAVHSKKKGSTFVVQLPYGN